jgi:cellulose synthase/poly-beta-1,6-N-acetylglucosamine synthase-like glycosyltransferase
MKAPLISVVIPDRYRPHLTAEAIDSVLSQRIERKNIEIILVIDNNKDYPRNLLKKKFPTIKIVNNKFEEGPGGSRSTGIFYSRGKYVSFLDSDDIWGTSFLKESILQLEKTKSAGTMSYVQPFFTGSYPKKERLKILFINYFRQFTLMYSYFINRGTLNKSFFWSCQMSHSIFKRDKIKNYKFEYQYRRGGEDWAFYINLLSKHKITIVPEKLVKFRYEIKSSTNQAVNISNKWKSYRRLVSNMPLEFKRGLGYKLFLLYLKLMSR